MSQTTPITPIPLPNRWPYLAVAAFVAVIHVIWVMAGDGRILDGNLAGTDGYLRLVRIATLYESGNWFEPGLARAGAPDGMVLHWTRPLDALLLALALPLVPAVGFKTALFWSGAVVSPLLHVLTAVALAWAAMPLLRRTDAFVAGALTTVQGGLMSYAVAGHADHHLLFAFTAALALGLVFRLLVDGGRRNGLAAGACLALGLWVGPESYVLLALCLGAVGVAWLVLGEPRWAERNLHLAAGLTLGLALALAVERGPAAYGAVEYDRLSIVHLTAAAGVLAFWFAVFRTPGTWRRWSVRVIAGGGGTATVVTVLGVLFPKLLAGPMADVDPAFVTLVADISEFAPITDAPRLLILAGSAMFAGPWMLWRLLGEWRQGRPWPWVLLVGGSILYGVLALSWIRASVYLGLFLPLALADLIGRVDAAISGRLVGAARTFANVGVLSVIAIGPMALGVVGLETAEGRQRGNAPLPACNLRALTRYLDSPPWKAPPRTILASVNFGPEILYRTGHRVVATLHHRNAAGVLDGIRILGSRDEAESRRLARRRGIDLMVLCPGSRHDGYLTPDGTQGSLYGRLMSGDPPAWIRSVAAPQGLAGFRLFRVVTGH